MSYKPGKITGRAIDPTPNSAHPLGHFSRVGPILKMTGKPRFSTTTVFFDLTFLSLFIGYLLPFFEKLFDSICLTPLNRFPRSLLKTTKLLTALLTKCLYLVTSTRTLSSVGMCVLHESVRTGCELKIGNLPPKRRDECSPLDFSESDGLSPFRTLNADPHASLVTPPRRCLTSGLLPRSSLHGESSGSLSLLPRRSSASISPTSRSRR